MAPTLKETLKTIKTRAVDAFERQAITGRRVTGVEVDLAEIHAANRDDLLDALSAEGWKVARDGDRVIISW